MEIAQVDKNQIIDQIEKKNIILVNDCVITEMSPWYAIAGWNLEIIHIFKQKCFQFEDTVDL